MTKQKRFRVFTAIITAGLIAGIGYFVVHKSHAAGADINGDGSVNITDLSILASNYGRSGMSFAQGDLNGDGSIGISDLSILAANWGTTSGDTTPPTTSITAPTNGATVTGSVSINANASDNVGVTKVEFYNGTTLINTDTTSPYSTSWDTTTVTNGVYSLTTKAYDAANNITTSVAVSVTANNTVSGIWHPTADRPYTMHWMLEGVLNTSDPVAMGLRDLNGNTLPAPDIYDIDGELNSAATVDALHAMGKKVICYIDAGVWEDYRSDATLFPGVQNEGKTYTGNPAYAGLDIIGSNDNGWPGSKWMDIRRVDILQPIMTARMLNWCKNKHFDAIEPDEITDWSNSPGFPLTYADQITYNRAVATWAHNLGLSIGLKGDLEQAHDLVTNFDWTLNEECFLYTECTTITNQGPGADGQDYPGLQLFAQANKAVWVAEYPSEYPANQRSGKTLTAAALNPICTTSKTQHFNTALYILGLPANGGRQPCPTTSATTW